MPGPGQGKHSQKKKWCKNAFNLDMNIAAVDTVMTALSTTALKVKSATLATLPPSARSLLQPNPQMKEHKPAPHAATKPTTAMTTENAATTAPSPDTSSFTYSHEEVQQLLEDARLDGWEEGYEEGSKRLMKGYRDGYEARWKLDQEKGKQACKKGLLEGYELGIQEGKEHEQQKWLMEGHSAGLCLLMAAHACALFHGAVILEEAETQTDAAPTTSVNVQTNAQPPTVSVPPYKWSRLTMKTPIQL
jgi:hypothetical protein